MSKRTKPACSLHKTTGQARSQINGRNHYLGEYGSPEPRDRYEDLVAEWFARNGDSTRHALTVDAPFAVGSHTLAPALSLIDGDLFLAVNWPY